MKKVKAAEILEDIIYELDCSRSWLSPEYDKEQYEEYEQRVEALRKAIKVLKK